MTGVRVTFAGSGDAFGSGGRLQTCVHLGPAGGSPVLLDCGATALIGLKRHGIEPNDVGTVVLSHLHGDHFAGLPYLILDGQFRRRTAPLEVVGPPGTEERLRQAMELLFPGSTRITRRFEVKVREIEPHGRLDLAELTVQAYPAEHFAGAPALCLRIGLAGRVIAYSGDTAWTETLVAVADGADLFICEAYTETRAVPFHLHLPMLRDNLPRLTCRRIVLTHAGPDVLARAGELDLEPHLELADDDRVIDV
ncbi:MBL fold metallo-hydrolase [Plantactinospora solaniradicis]|uniref:MBL fold metallo-hydrolase n=1 Tax=Plantactinospora solaniradicis TaxID=1723736 RepID=A0ABW1K1S4_9ACTN